MVYKLSEVSEDVRYFQASGNELIETYPEFSDGILENWSAAENIAKKIVEKLNPYFQFKNEGAIGYYLSYNQFLVPVLEECYHSIKNYFTQDESIVLELIQDPMDNIEKLVIYIITHLPPKAAIELLRTFYRESWIRYSPDIRKHIVIDVEST